MHAYASDAEDRKTVPTVLAVLAVAATLLLVYLIQTLKLQIPWWVDAPSVMGFYGIFYGLYNRVLWRLHIGPIRLSMIPDVSGVWAGVLTSSYNTETKINIVFFIDQTWSKIRIRTATETSTSFTTMAAFYTESNEPGLTYEYLSKPGPFAKETMHMHPGTGHLDLSSNGRTLEGQYYTGRDRQTFGSLKLYFVSKEKISFEDALKRLTPEQVNSGS